MRCMGLWSWNTSSGRMLMLLLSSLRFLNLGI